MTGNLANLMSSLAGSTKGSHSGKRAIALEPLRSEFPLQPRVFSSALGRYDEAEAALRKAIELQPQSAQNYEQLAIIQILRGKPGAAVELAKQETDPSWRTYALALAQFANGDRAGADAALKKLIDEDADAAGSQIAQVYALRKEPEKMFEWLEHAWTTHDAPFAPRMEFCIVHARGWVAQLVEQRTENPRVGGSIPSPATSIKLISTRPEPAG